jgi:hypothetical protein
VFYTPKKGHLEFTDSDFVAFKGIASMPAVGSNVPLVRLQSQCDA